MSTPSSFASSVSEDILNKLYPIPASTGAPGLPGPTHEAALATLEALRHDFANHHVYFNDFNFHNHSSHYVLALYALGAPPDVIKNAYANERKTLRPAFASPTSINEDNFSEHLGDAKYYDAYLAFFTAYLQKNSATEAIERFIFSPAYNFTSDLEAVNKRDRENGARGAKQHPEMLNRFLAGLIHPFIHVSYGVEFGLLGQVAEGLAQAAIHGAEIHAKLVPSSYFTKAGGGISELLSRLTSSLSLSASTNGKKTSERRPTFEFHRRVSEDPAFNFKLAEKEVFPRFVAVVQTASDSINSLVQEWTAQWLADTHSDAEAEKRLQGMVEEVTIGNVLWYGVGGWASRGDSGRVTNTDFFLMHLVTSALFLPTLVLNEAPSSALPFASRLLLLQTFLGVSTAWQIARGNHPLTIVPFYAATPAQLTVRSAAPAGAKALPSYGSAWARILAGALLSPDEHVPKAVRALAEYARRWGTRAPGYYAGALEGAETLDGTLFVRVAGITFDRLGWVNEGEEFIFWDQDGSSVRG
ncbi:hypothetical protein BC834DRAFT_845236 [Gloeopeniophorella convolvens]|nr:hypothetical protein BC834DRAFT_845236 [Gloeopeniophorella convolvens]